MEKLKALLQNKAIMALLGGALLSGLGYLAGTTKEAVVATVCPTVAAPTAAPAPAK